MSAHGIGVAYGRVAPKVEKPEPVYWCVACNVVPIYGGVGVCIDCAEQGFTLNPVYLLDVADRAYTPSGNCGVVRPSKRLGEDDATPWQENAIRAMEDRG